MSYCEPTRREVLGWLAWLATAPLSTQCLRAQDATTQSRYLGCASRLAKSFAGFEAMSIEWDLIADTIGNPSSWILLPNLRVFFEEMYFPEVPRLVERGVVSVAEFNLCKSGRGFLNLYDYGVEIAVLADSQQAAAQIRRFDGVPKEAGYEPLADVGDEAILSTGGWSFAGKIFFRAANVVASVCPHLNEDHSLARRMAHMLCMSIETEMSMEQLHGSK